MINVQALVVRSFDNKADADNYVGKLMADNYAQVDEYFTKYFNEGDNNASKDNTYVVIGIKK